MDCETIFQILETGPGNALDTLLPFKTSLQSGQMPLHLKVAKLCLSLRNLLRIAPFQILLLLDLAAAFDRVGYEILLSRLQEFFGVTGMLFNVVFNKVQFWDPFCTFSTLTAFSLTLLSNLPWVIIFMLTICNFICLLSQLYLLVGV